MNCIVTAGPTYEPLDDVRRLTNFSTGRLGSELADFLTRRGHLVTLLLGEQATFRGERLTPNTQIFSTTADLRDKLKSHSQKQVDAVFHAAAVSDYTFGRVWLRAESGEMVEVRSGKISTHAGVLLTELVPTPKILPELRAWYPKASLVGWKYEVEGDQASAIALAEKQIAECHTDACVANGPAYGKGFGLVNANGTCVHQADSQTLYSALENFLRAS